jgi:hypothetical protein
MLASCCEKRILCRTLEHQVFEKMRDARLAPRLVGGADAIPQHVRDDGRAAVRNDHHAQPIGELELGDRGRRDGILRGQRDRRANGEDGEKTIQ